MTTTVPWVGSGEGEVQLEHRHGKYRALVVDDNELRASAVAAALNGSGQASVIVSLASGTALTGEGTFLQRWVSVLARAPDA